jgi:ParB-like chromosome segregation protein Spo0J
MTEDQLFRYNECRMILDDLIETIKELPVEEKPDMLEFVIRRIRNECNVGSKSPVYNVIAVPIDKIEANDYNPNHVAKREMELLYQSIKSDGYTMPIVCFYDKDRDKYVIVDGFHRYTIMLRYKNIFERENGMLPVSVIEKDISDRMASTIRHNRARGKHEVELQASLVGMLKAGWDELKIMKELGMTLEEVQRLIGIKGIASEIRGVPYSIERQIKDAGEDIEEEI